METRRMITGQTMLVALGLACVTSSVAVVCRIVLMIDPGMYGVTQVAAMATPTCVVSWVWLIVAWYAHKVLRRVEAIEVAVAIADDDTVRRLPSGRR